MNRIYISDTNIWIDFNNAGFAEGLEVRPKRPLGLHDPSDSISARLQP